MADDLNAPAHKPYDPYAPEVVRKMAVVALVCALGAWGIAALFGIGGFYDYQDYTRAIDNGEAIYAPWLIAWLLAVFGPIGVAVFYEAFAFLFLGLGTFAAREWWVMRKGIHDPARDTASAGLLGSIALVGAVGLLIFLAIVRIYMALGN